MGGNQRGKTFLFIFKLIGIAQEITYDIGKH